MCCHEQAAKRHAGQALLFRQSGLYLADQQFKSYWYCTRRMQEDALLLTYADVCRKMMPTGLHPDTSDAEAGAQERHRFCTLYLNVRLDASICRCEREWLDALQTPQAHRYHLYDIPWFYSLRAMSKRHMMCFICA